MTEQIRNDAIALERGDDPVAMPLWSVPPPAWIASALNSTRAHWQSDPAHAFWRRWYDAAVAGTPLNWELQRDIALISDEDWQAGPKVVAERIAEIEAKARATRDMTELEQDLARLPPAPTGQIAITRAAMQQNRKALPPTFDAIEGLIVLEIERLQGRNFVDDFDRDETRRQISVFVSLYEAICVLRQELPKTGDVTDAQAERSEGWLRIYASKFGSLPVAKADEVVEGLWATGRGIVQAGLIGTTTALAMAYGVPALAGVTIGAMIFAPKNAADLVKAAKEALTVPK